MLPRQNAFWPLSGALYRPSPFHHEEQIELKQSIDVSGQQMQPVPQSKYISRTIQPLFPERDAANTVRFENPATTTDYDIDMDRVDQGEKETRHNTKDVIHRKSCTLCRTRFISESMTHELDFTEEHLKNCRECTSHTTEAPDEKDGEMDVD